MMRNDLSVTVPAQAVIGGTAGNIGAHALSRSITPLDGVGSFTNAVAFTGGTEAESDEQLRTRFKRTIFRNLAGTESMFLGVALEDPDVLQVNVIGAAKVHREQIEIVNGVAQASPRRARYIYPGTATLGPDIDAGLVFTEGIHYAFDYGTRTVVVLNALVPDGVYDLEFEFVPEASRNDPPNGVTNRVDLYVKGTRPTEVEEIAIFRTSQTFDQMSSSPLYRENFRRVGTNTRPGLGNFLVSLSYGPVISSTNSTLVINGQTYVEGIDYWPVNDITNEGGTLRSRHGLEFRTGTGIADRTTFTCPYVYNAVPGDVEQAARAWRLVTTDVRVHTAQLLRLRLHLVVMLDPGAVASSVQGEVETTLATYLDSIDFARVIQVSDLLHVVKGVSGVDAVRFATDADDENDFAIQRVSDDGTVEWIYTTSGGTPLRATDIVLDHDQVPQFHSLTFTVKAQNTFGAV